jgi:PHD/YefM family antitoxin component YafN of YafNO toxin-antitoxin module
MKTVNALKIRNNLGEVLDLLDKTGEPILISKGRTIRAALITPEQFKTRFLDFHADEQKQKLLDTIADLKKKARGRKDSLTLLRELRGYDQ